MKLKELSYTVSGIVESGYTQARNSGYPTANLALKESPGIPQGIYCGWTQIEGNEKRIPSLVFYGIPHALPDVTEPRFEVHLFEGDYALYDKELTVELAVFVRENKKFENAALLQKAIEDDITQAREYFEL